MKKKFLVVLLAIVSTLAIAFGLSACNLLKAEYKLSFVVDGEVYATINTNGEEVISMPEDPVKEDYIFDGWYWDNDVWSRPFTANSLLNEKLTSNMSVYAKWIEETVAENQFTLTFNSMGGSSVDEQTIKYGQTASEPTKPTKAGYIFVGWYKEADFTNKWDFATDTITGDITLYAKWVDETDAAGSEIISANGFTINDNILSIKVANAQNNFALSEAITVSPYATWTVTADIEGKNEIPSATVSLSEGNNTYYINVVSGNGSNKKQYTVNIRRREMYSVTYRLNNGDTNITEQIEEDSTLENKNITKTGYSFVEWQYGNNAWNFENTISENMTLVAVWSANNYKVSFNSNHGSAVEDASVTYDAEFVLTVPQENGYTFNGWKTESGIMLTDKDGKGLSVWNIADDITVYADWSVNEYTITYNLNGGNNDEVNPVKYTVEDNNITLAEATKAGYTFKGWYSDAEFTESVTQIDVSQTKNVELFAKWEVITYTATFVIKGATVEQIPFTVETVSIEEPDITPENGYTAAWSEYELIADNLTITAIYTLIEYSITYENTKGAENDNATSYTIESEAITIADVSVNGYTFDGWYNGEVKVTEISAGSYGDIILTAKWIADTYTITYIYDADIGDYAEGMSNPASYTIEDEFEFVDLVNKTEGYISIGWFSEKNNGSGIKVSGISRGTTGNITVYAQWGLEVYSITYNNVEGVTNTNATTYTVESDTFTIESVSKTGYTFNGWFADEEYITPANLTITKGSNGDITLYAKWTPITYTIEYVTYGGTATGNPTTYIVTDDITFNNATLSGYVFKGWYTAAEGGSKVNGISAGTTGNIILYAHWDYVSTITFESNGGSLVDAISNVEGTAISAPVAPTKEHYTFAGWCNDSALTEAYTFTTQPAEDITLYAKWAPVVYEIEYALNGGLNSEYNVAEYTVEDKIELYAPSKVGYTFIGWFTDSEFTSVVVTELPIGTSGKITLYAHYSINQYTISFESNGGTSVASITQNYATSVNAPESPAKNGYSFAGWYSNESLTKLYTFSTMPAENITLYAKWNLVTYNIIYNLNGGINSNANPANYTILNATITLSEATKTGYSFAGWYTDAECTAEITEIISGSYGDVELFAKWTAIEYTIIYLTADGATHSNITTYTIETDLTALAEATLKGYTFGGWYTDDSYTTAVTNVAGGEIGNKTIYAQFSANTYNVWLDGNEEASCTVSFNLNGAEGTIESQTVTPTVKLEYPTDPTRDGYIFAGWYANEDCTGSLYDFTAIVTSDTTLYAKWVKVENATAIAINGSLDITLNGKVEQMLMFVPLVSGNITITASGSYDTFGVLYNSEMTALVQNDDGAADGINFHIVYNVTAGETYYIGARAFSSTATGTATISISGNNTVADGGYTVTTSKTTVTYGQSFTFAVPDARDGYKFLGYKDAEGVMYTDETGASIKTWDKDSETTLYSVWERTVYTVTFVTNGGTEIEPITLAYGDRFDISQYTTTRAGYTFNGWYLDGVEYNATTMPDHSITLTAYWKTFALGSIKYDTDKTAISVNDEITAELFSAICLDTDGNLATFSVTVSGTQEAGNEITVRLTATSGGKTKVVTITDIKVYGMPTLTFDNTVDYVNINGGITASHFGASGTDSFGTATKINIYFDGEYEAGDLVTIVIESIDPVGNITYGYIDNVKAYGLPEIRYNSDKNVISVSDTLNAELFGATAKDTFGETLVVTVTKYSGTISAGNTVIIRISATDSKGNTTNIDVTCKVYGNPTILNATATDVKVSDTITAELLGITANDTYGEALAVALSVKDGSQSAGTSMIVTAIVTDIAGNVSTKDYTLKVYGVPTISYDRTAVKISEDAVASPSSVLNASAKDSFGKSLTVAATLNGTFEAGKNVTYTLTTTDHLGNTYSMETSPIGVYDVGDIRFNYDSYAGRTDIIKLTSKGEEFDAQATDSFGNACTISIEAAEGYTLIGGETVTIYIVATDRAGNRVMSEGVEGIKIYDDPTINLTQDNFVITEDTDVNFLFTAYDSFNEELFTDVSVIGEQTAGNTILITVSATDDADNTAIKEFVFGVLPSEKPFVELYYNGELWQVLFVDDAYNYTLPMPELESGYVGIWVDAAFNKYTNTLGIGQISLSSSIQLDFYCYKEGYTLINEVNQLKNISLSGKYCLAVDIDLCGDEWIPIGRSSLTSFSGIFDGNGHTISNFKITDGWAYAGLFGYNNGKIKNLGVENFIIDSSYTPSTYTTSAAYFGGLVGYNGNGVIENCYATGYIDATTTGSSSNSVHAYVGGLVGYNSSMGTIANCYATDDVTAFSSFDMSSAGGLVGENCGIIANCYATGEVTASSASTSYSHFAGGLVGYNLQGVISNCYAVGDITTIAIPTSSSSSRGVAGGLVGWNNGGAINNCYRYLEQQFTVKQVDSTSSNATNTLGKAVDYNSIHSKEWHQYTLKWEEIDIWDFSGSYPSLNYKFINSCIILEISTAEQLLGLQDVFLAFDYILTSDIDLGGIEWTPILGFLGTFDGNGHTISNFKITNDREYAGLFGYNNGEIKNIGVKNFIINISYSSSAYVGGLVGYNSGQGTIINCYATGEVTASTVSSHAYVGGLVGENYGTVVNSYATGEVTASTASNFTSVYAGGLVGYNVGTIEYCYATGSIAATTICDSMSSAQAYAGGLIGYNEGVIKNCYAIVDVTTIATATANSSSSATSYAGGLVGYNSGQGTIINCYATGEVKADSSSYTYASSASSYTGGLIGCNGGVVNNCYATGNATASSSSSNAYAGGLVGYNNSNQTIANCYATGDVKASSSSSNVYAGGLVGYNRKGTITNCYRYSEQKFTVDNSSTISNSATNIYGTEVEIDNFYSKEWHQNTLGWTDVDIWNFDGTSYPTLNN
ncbi:MAG: InlB B-repeat-containing protein [Candidatus Coproplasma sp.]